MVKNSSWSKWYAEHKDQHNAKRRERYRNDPDVRAKARQNAARNRSKGDKVNRVSYKRKVGNFFVTFFPITKAAADIDRSAQLIRVWEKKGYIPEPLLDDSRRLYTEKQIALMKDLAEFMDTYRANKIMLAKMLPDIIDRIKNQWDQFK